MMLIMRAIAFLALVSLAVVAAVLSMASLGALPTSFAEFRHEPEDLYGGIFWATTLGGLAVFWISTAKVVISEIPKKYPGPTLQGAAAVVVAFGALLAYVAVIDPLDRVLAALLAALCIMTGSAVLLFARLTTKEKPIPASTLTP
jgi:hypothetical protein